MAEGDPFSEKFENLGIESFYSVMNMGTMFLVFAFNLSLLVLYLPLVTLGARSRFCRVLARKIHRAMFWRWQTIFVQEAYLDLLLTVSVNFIVFDHGWNSP